MTNPLTDTQLDDIQARLAAATPGPWGVYESGSMIDVAADLQDTGCGYRARREICRLEEEPLDNDPAHREWTAEEDWAQVQADATFIAHAPADVRALLDEIRRLRAELDDRTEALASADDPTRLRWGLNDVLWGDDDTITVLLSGPGREPYWLELEPERAAVLREDLAGPPAEGPPTAVPTRTLTDSEYNAAWHAVEGAAGEEGADPGTVLHAVLDRLGIDLPPAPPVHGCPPDGSGITPCCGRTPFELPRTDRMATNPALVTCAG